MLDRSLNEDDKQVIMIKKLSALLKGFSIFLLLLSFSCMLAIFPVILYLFIEETSVQDVDTRSFKFYVAMLLGSLILFVIPSKDKGKDYNEWTKLLHRMILDNYNISRGLFNFEKKVFRRRIKDKRKNFVIVTGLARGGTTALTNLLYESQHFYSLSYSNMPFILSVNLWSKIYSPRKNKLKERAHKDNIKFGYKSIEALEEYFYKAQLNDSFIEESTLVKHDISQKTYEDYISYQLLVGLNSSNSVYLAKNNNLILRYRSIRSYNKDFHILLMLRHPVEHAKSLVKQHLKFSERHEEDPFSLEYMNWLGHHEFGLNHKPFKLDADHNLNFPIGSLDYWVSSWVEYYSYVLQFVIEDRNLHIIDYSDLCSKPDRILQFACGLFDLALGDIEITPYRPTQSTIEEIDTHLLEESERVYRELLSHKVHL